MSVDGGETLDKGFIAGSLIESVLRVLDCSHPSQPL